MISELIDNLKILPRWIIIVIDVVFIALATLLAFLLRFNFVMADMVRHNFELGILLTVLCGITAIVLTRSYAGIIRYTGIQDSWRIGYTTFLGLALSAFVNLLYHYYFKENLIPFSVVGISFFSIFLFLFGYRVIVKSVFAHYKGSVNSASKVMIFGAGELGIITRNVFETTSTYRIAGFLEDDQRKVGKDMGGLKIFNAADDIGKLLIDQSVTELIIAVNELSIDRKNELVDQCLKVGVKVRTVPPVEKWVKGSLSLNQIKDINIEDLLGRESIQISDEHIISEFLNKKILITGAAGSIGSEIVRQLQHYGPTALILVDQAETPLFEIDLELSQNRRSMEVYPYVADITQESKMDAIFEQHRPDFVFHAAAYKHVPMMEKHPDQALECNVKGTKIIADLALKYKVKRFVMVSTDKAVNPTNVMGASKRIAELYVQSLHHKGLNSNSNTSFITTRFGNVLGSNGSVIPLFKRQIAEGGPITVTHPDITRYFMTIPEACRLVLEAGIMGKGGEIFLFDMGKSVKIVDLAKKMIMLSGFRLWKDIDIVFTGLREGEKLHEELLAGAENTQPTHHPKIMIALNQQLNYTVLDKEIAFLINMDRSSNDHFALVMQMKKIVPEFISNISRFSKLDVA